MPRFFRFSGLLAFCVALLVPQVAVRAGDFVVDGASTTQNAGHTIDGADSLTVNAGGSISTSGTDTVLTTGAGNRLTNEGTLSTTGDNVDAIDASGGLMVLNTGTIQTFGHNSFGFFGFDDDNFTNMGLVSTVGDDSVGVSMRTFGTLVNNGTIRTMGRDADGVFVLDDNVITNNGLILTSGDDAFGIRAGCGSTITNRGTIRVLGDAVVDIDAIEVCDDSNVSNFGLIETFGFGSDGIDSDDFNVVTNAGRILVHGVDAEAIDVDNFSTVTNSGSLVSVQGNSIDLDGLGNTLNLLAPAFLGGAINFGGFTAEVNITTGRSQSLAWSLPTASLVGGAPNVGGAVPSAYDGSVFATLDPTVLTSIFDMMGARNQALFGLMQARRGRIDAAGAGGAAGALNGEALAYVGQAKSEAVQVIDATFGTLAADAGPHYWSSLFGNVGHVRANGIFNQQFLANGGAAVGVDAQVDAEISAGLMAGYMFGAANGLAAFATSFENVTHSGFVGGYGRFDAETMFVDVALAAGVTGHNNRRLVNDNLAPLGVSWANGAFGSVWIAPEVAAGFTYQVNADWRATPSVRLRGGAEWLGGYADTGTVANVSVPDRMAGYGEVALDYGLRGQFADMRVDLNGGYAYRAMVGNGTTSVSLLGQTLAVPSLPGNQHLFYANAELVRPVHEGLDFTFGAGAVVGTQYLGGQAKIGLSGKL